ncbi:hypothetical protein GTNG_1261 [Geobacillus thermodenitrificans NG80-2]|uniref:Uncharacterized protein n=1 Tax=Geobacillus thermodenitrificans (strain NG80-2) TaxID=420246 RepID=A4IMS7_GEOTN|nr:hypothetical protein GTNG_1261 [Geobacillus thermodenitrificans NG80-2]
MREGRMRLFSILKASPFPLTCTILRSAFSQPICHSCHVTTVRLKRLQTYPGSKIKSQTTSFDRDIFSSFR